MGYNTASDKATSLFAIVAWVREEGEVRAENRLRIRTLPLTMREGISIDNIRPTTRASDYLLQAMLLEATLIVGKPFPTSLAKERKESLS